MSLPLTGVAGSVVSVLSRFGLLLSVVAVPSLLIGLHFRDALSRSARLAYGALILALLALFGLRAFSIVHANIVHPHEFDFFGFWLNGHVAASGANFYDPAFARALAQPFHPSTPFTQEIIDVGFWYPPPSIFVFLPLGYFDLHGAYAMWYVLNGVAFALDVVLLWKIFFDRADWLTLGTVAALLLMMPATTATLALGQTTFIALLALLAFWHARNQLAQGAWVAVGVIVKPFLAVLFLWSLLRGKVRVTLGAVSALVVLSLASLLVWGPTTFLSYFRPQHYAALPNWVYTEVSNQSLLAVILRATSWHEAGAAPTHNVLFLGLAAVLAAATIALVWRLSSAFDDWALVAALTFALLVYPVSQAFYSELLIVPALLLWKQRSTTLGLWGTIGFVTVEFAALGYHNGAVTFLATTLNWLLFASLGTVSLLNVRRARLVGARTVSV